MARGSKKVIYAALAGNTLVALTKFAAAAITGSSAMLSEGIHSVVDTGNQALLLHGMRQAAKPADSRFPFGYGKEIYFWSFVVAILIFAVGSGVSIYEGVHHLFHPREVGSLWMNYVVLLIAMVIEGAALYVAVEQFSKSKGKWGYLEAVRRGKDPTEFVVLFEDSAAILGLFVAFVGVLASHLTGSPVFDAVASILIGLILGGTAVWLAFETKGLLIGESASDATVQAIKNLALGHPGIDRVNEVLTMHMGPDFILANLSVAFSPEISAAEVTRTIAKLDYAIKQAHPRVKRVFVEAEDPQQVLTRP